MAEKNLLTEVERLLQEKYSEGGTLTNRMPSTASVPRSERIDQLVLPDENRPRMPLTKDQYLVREDPYMVQWERELRKFLRRLSPDHGHRISAVMIFEWATGLVVTELMQKSVRVRPGQRSWRSDIRTLNKLLKLYFDKPYMTYIAGHKVPRAYRVPAGYYIYRHRPKTLTLWVEWKSGIKL